MILFHAKRDGTVTTTPDLVPQGSSMQDLVVVSEFDYAYCAIKLLPASGEYIEDISCTPILQKDYSTIFTADLPPKATVVAGSVDYQLIFTAADGTTQTTLVGSFTVPRGVPASTPPTVGELSSKTVGDLYAIIGNVYALFAGHEANIYQSIEDIAALKKTIASAGYVTIPVSEWEDGSPTIALFTLDGFGKGMFALLMPADSNTQTAARDARLSALPDVFRIDDDSQTVEIIRANADKAPDIPLRFAYIILKTSDTTVAPTVAIIGVDASGGGGGVDQAAVEDTVRRLIPEWALEEEPPEERDPSVYNWAKAATKPSYTAAEVGADPDGTAEALLSIHNVSDNAHNDIRMLVEAHREEVNALLAVDDSTLDELSEIVAYIKNNKSLIESITDSKVSKTDIVNNLTTNVTNKPLSAAQGVAIKSLIDAKIGTENLAEEVAAQIEAAKENGELGVRGPGILKVSTTPTSYTTAIGGKNPIKRMSIATIKKEADVDEVIIGDNIQHSTYLYRIYYLDSTYAYMDTSQNLKGSTGSAGTSAYKYAQNGGYTGTEAQFTESLAIAGDIENHIPSKTSQLTNDSGYVTSSNAETWTFTLANGSTVTKKVVLA